MFLEQQVSILDCFLKDHVTLKTGGLMLKIQLWSHSSILHFSCVCVYLHHCDELFYTAAQSLCSKHTVHFHPRATRPSDPTPANTEKHTHQSVCKHTESTYTHWKRNKPDYIHNPNHLQTETGMWPHTRLTYYTFTEDWRSDIFCTRFPESVSHNCCRIKDNHQHNSHTHTLQQPVCV